MGFTINQKQKPFNQTPSYQVIYMVFKRWTEEENIKCIMDVIDDSAKSVVEAMELLDDGVLCAVFSEEVEERIDSIVNQLDELLDMMADQYADLERVLEHKLKKSN